MYSTNTFPYIKVHINLGEESLEINTLTVNIDMDILSRYERFTPWEEPKWIKFCKKHNFNPIKDFNTKFYRLYLDMCAEGII